MKKHIKSIFIALFRFKHRKHASIGDVCVFGLKSRIINRTKNSAAIVIHNRVMMHGSLIVEGNGKIILSECVNIRRNTYVGSTSRVFIGRGVIISDGVTIMDNNNHPVDPTARREMVESGWTNANWSWTRSESAPITIEENVWIGQNARIHKGVTVGRNSIIAANAVVTKDVSADVIAAGNPAREVKKLGQGRQ